MSDPTGAVPAEGAAPAPESTPASAPEPWAPVVDRVDQLAGTVDQLANGFQQWQQAQQPAPEPEPDPWADLQAMFSPEQPPEPEPQPQLDPAALQNVLQQAVQQANAPLMQQVQAMQAERAREQLYTQIPQLKDPAVAQQTIDSMATAYQQAGERTEDIQRALQSPFLIAQFFKAAEAEKLAAGQAPASEQVPNVESAGGAVPGGNGEQPNIVHQVFGSRAAGLPKGFG